MITRWYSRCVSDSLSSFARQVTAWASSRTRSQAERWLPPPNILSARRRIRDPLAATWGSECGSWLPSECKRLLGVVARFRRPSSNGLPASRRCAGAAQPGHAGRLVRHSRLPARRPGRALRASIGAEAGGDVGAVGAATTGRGMARRGLLAVPRHRPPRRRAGVRRGHQGSRPVGHAAARRAGERQARRAAHRGQEPLGRRAGRHRDRPPERATPRTA